MEVITGYILNHFLGLAANLNSDYILTAYKNSQAEQLLQEEQACAALKAFRPIAEDVRLACLKLADQHERLWVSPAQKQLCPLLRDPRFHQDFVEWLQIGAIEEGEPVKARMIQKMDALLASAEITEEQRQFLHHYFFDALDKAIFANNVLSRWRLELSLRFLREQVVEGKRLAEEAAGKYSEERQSAALDAYCRLALTSWDIIDLTNLPDDRDVATQKLLLRQLYMPLRIGFEAQKGDRNDQDFLDSFEELREAKRLRDAGRRSASDSRAIDETDDAVPIGERLGSGHRFVVLGDPGGGKTTMLRWLATAYLLRHIGDPASDQLPDAQTLPAEAWIPVLIRCRDIGEADLCRSFKDVLTMHLNKTELQPQDAQVMLAVILDRLAKGEMLLLIDGLDEISNRRVRQTFCQQIERTAVRYPDAPILVTSRIVGYRNMPDRMRTGFIHGVISDLHPTDKNLFACRWVEATEWHKTKADRERSAQGLIAALHSTDRIERLTGNPMLLTTMALVKRKVGKLPTRRNKLYAEAVSVLLNWNPNVYTAIEEEEALPQLSFLAYEMCRHGVQRLTGDEVLDLLDQLRSDHPKIRSLRQRNSQEFLHLLEERSGLLMRSGVQWHPNQSQEKAVWEFRHLTFQEYLAALALKNGHYAGRDSSQSLAEQVAPLAVPVPREVPEPRFFQEGAEAVPDSWREALRLLVSLCSDDDVDDVLLSILHPGPEGEEAKTQGPRAVLAAQCLADEPNVGEDTAHEVLERFVACIGEEDGLAAIRSNVEEVALEVWGSHPDHRNALQACLLKAFAEAAVTVGGRCGALLAQLLGSTTPKTAEELEGTLKMACSNLESPDEAEAICAALQVLELAFQGCSLGGKGLEMKLLALLGRGGASARAAAWSLAWLSVGQPSDRAKRRSVSRNRVDPPVLATEWVGAGDLSWQPTEHQARDLVEALERASVSEGGWKRHLIVLLGKSAQPCVVVPLLQTVGDPVASVREASCEALAWLANHLPSPLLPAQLETLEELIGAGLVRNRALAEKERCDGLVVVALFGRERLLREVLSDPGEPVAIRRQAAEGLGLMASRCVDSDQRRLLREELEGWLRDDALNLLVGKEEGWAEHDRLLPLLQGASRSLQLAASAELPLMGSGPGRKVPMLTLTALREGEGLWICTEVVEREVWKLPLPKVNGLPPQQLELVVVPEGEYPIGSPESEEGRDWYGDHWDGCKGVNVEAERKVRVERFAMVRHLISQAQWQAVAELPRLERDLNLTPGSYKSDDLWERFAQPGGLPVDSVRWLDGQEWLSRLNRWLLEQWSGLGGQADSPQLALPGEGQWEVACRAGAATPFHFGDTLDASWANFDGGYSYGPSRKGPYRQRPVAVGFFGLVNRWGLAEMHGQLFEWCGDQWHPDPTAEGWPSDGMPWEGVDPTLEAMGTAQKDWKLLRGGSGFDEPRYCRAAYRGSVPPALISAFVGFRPCCLLPPGSLLGS